MDETVFWNKFIIGGCRRHTLHMTGKNHLSPSILIITAKLTTLAKKNSLFVSSPPDFIQILVTHVNTTWEVSHILTEGLLGFDWQLWSVYKVSLSSWKKKRKLKIKLLLHVCLFLKTFSISWENKIFVTWRLSWLLNIQGGKCFFANNIYLAFLPAWFWRAN